MTRAHNIGGLGRCTDARGKPDVREPMRLARWLQTVKPERREADPLGGGICRV